MKTVKETVGLAVGPLSYAEAAAGEWKKYAKDHGLRRVTPVFGHTVQAATISASSSP